MIKVELTDNWAGDSPALVVGFDVNRVTTRARPEILSNPADLEPRWDWDVDAFGASPTDYVSPKAFAAIAEEIGYKARIKRCS